jgi:polar amino acid transport system permease protein
VTAFAWKDLAEFTPLLAQGAVITVEVFVCGLIVATVLGLTWALMRVSGVPMLAGFSKGLINTVRGIPILVQLFYIYFVLPAFGIRFDPFMAGVIGLSVNYSA